MNILGYSDAAQLQRRSTDTVTELVLRWCVYWPNRLGWRQKVLQPPSMFMLLSWWCPLGHDKRHLPAIQIFIAVQLIPILTNLSSRWTVSLISFFFLIHFSGKLYGRAADNFLDYPQIWMNYTVSGVNQQASIQIINWRFSNMFYHLWIQNKLFLL